MHTSASVTQLHDLIDRRDAAPSAVRLPVHPTLAVAFPHGLRAGAVYAVTGSTSVALGLLAGPSRDGSWCAVAGLPDLGIEAAAAWGVDLARLILVPHPEAGRWAGTIATLTEVADVVVARPERLDPGELTRLTARLRTRRTALVVLGPWPRATTVQVTCVGWDGLEQGHGCLLRQHLRLDITERHVRRSVQVTVEPGGTP